MDYRNKIVEVARSQVGVMEPKGDDKYIKWYNTQCKTNLPMNAPWCACFVSWCLRNGGLPTYMLGDFASCSVAINEAKKKKIWYARTTSYVPHPGDLVFFDWDGDRRADHVGIIESSKINTIGTIEGNTKNGEKTDGVKKKTYSINSNSIFGYISLDPSLQEEPSNKKLTLIEQAQNTLVTKFGETIAVDGIWGRASKKALISNVQNQINLLYKTNLVVDGIWGKNTSRCFPEISQGNKSDLVLLMQVALLVRKYDLQLDGIFGENTRKAVVDFQSKNGLNADGIIGRKTAEKLL